MTLLSAQLVRVSWCRGNASKHKNSDFFASLLQVHTCDQEKRANEMARKLQSARAPFQLTALGMSIRQSGNA